MHRAGVRLLCHLPAVACLLACSLALSGEPLPGDEPKNPDEPEPRKEVVTPEERVIVRLASRRVAVRVGPDDETPCASPGAYLVRIDGTEVAVRAVTATPAAPRRILVLDSSDNLPGLHGMNRIRQAAREYIRRLPASASVGVFTLDQDLHLLVPLRPGLSAERRAEILERISTFRTGWKSYLVDHLELLVSQLDDGEGATDVVLITDIDLVDHPTPADQLIESAAAAGALRISSIVVTVPEAMRTRVADHLPLLRALPQATGGVFADLGRMGESAAVDAVLPRTERQYEVFFEVPQAFVGRGAVKVEIAPNSEGCRVETVEFVRAFDAPPAEGEDPVNRSIPVAPEAPKDLGYRIGDRIRLRTRDLSRDAGLLYDGKRRSVVSFEERILASRDVELPIEDPAIVGSRSWIDAAIEAVWLDPSATWMSGTGILWLRGPLADRIASVPEYRAWVEDRARRIVAQDIPELEACGRPCADVRARLVEERLRSPGFLTSKLAAWHRDVPARELTDDAQIRLANRLLYLRDEGAPRAAAAMTKSWSRVRERFSAPTSTRIVSPLRLLHDDTSDSYGFVRVLLPELRPLERRPVADTVIPERPLLLEAALARFTRGERLASPVLRFEVRSRRRQGPVLAIQTLDGTRLEWSTEPDPPAHEGL